jgi:hypothetical protein
MLGRTPTAEWKGPLITTSRAATSAVNGALDSSKSFTESIDESSLPSAVSTEPDHGFGSFLREGSSGDLGVESFGSSFFAETKTSSDDCAVETGATPKTDASGSARRGDAGSREDKQVGTDRSSTPTPRDDDVPKYKIALASSLLAKATSS